MSSSCKNGASAKVTLMTSCRLRTGWKNANRDSKLAEKALVRTMTSSEELYGTLLAKRCCLMVAAVLFFLMLFQPSFLASEEVREHQPPAPRYQSAEYCRSCHPDIYKYWSQSMHAHSTSDPVFQTAFLRATSESGEKTREFCLSCHSPTTMITKDFDLKDDLSRQGVTCDFCHTVTDVIEGDHRNLFEFQLGDTKFGPLTNIQPIGNLAFRYSELHTSARLCSGCHELESVSGIKVLGTYSEWKESSYAKQGVQCQNCHMPELFNVPVVPAQIRSTANYAHAHEFLGGHSQIRLEKAASLSIVPRREGNRIFVDAFVTNEEAGHYLPTEMPTRKIVLEVSLKDEAGKTLNKRNAEYRRILADSEGKAILTAEHAMMQAARVLSDNRIKPKEVRHEVFSFANLLPLKPYLVTATLTYSFEIATPEPNMIRSEMANAVKLVPPVGGFRYDPGIRLLVIIFLGLVLIVLFWRIARKVRQ